MIRLLPYVVEVLILVFCLIDAIMADDSRVRNLPKWGWILLIIVIPLVGGIAWLVAGRPVDAPQGPPPPPVARPPWGGPPPRPQCAPPEAPPRMVTGGRMRA